MWRAAGAGEMYLYVPNEAAQAGAGPLCDSPGECEGREAVYGLSVGRGSWAFARGAWTTVRQEVSLGTPGVADGAFRVWADGRLVIQEDAVMFRTAVASRAGGGAAVMKAKGAGAKGAGGGARPEAAAPPGEAETTRARAKSTTTKPGTIRTKATKAATRGKAEPTFKPRPKPKSTTRRSTARPKPSTPYKPAVDRSKAKSPARTTAAKASKVLKTSGLLGKLVGSVLHHDHRRTHDPLPADDDASPLHPAPVAPGSVLAAAPARRSPVQPAGFVGIMFDTFFGGNSPDYASPKEQVIYFNRLSIEILD